MSDTVSVRIDAVRVEIDFFNMDAEIGGTNKFSLDPAHPLVAELRAEGRRQLMAKLQGEPASWEGILG